MHLDQIGSRRNWFDGRGLLTLGLGALLAMLFACRPEPSAPGAQATAAVASQTKASASDVPFTIGEIRRQVLLAFRPNANAFTASDRTRVVHVAESGAFEITPSLPRHARLASVSSGGTASLSGSPVRFESKTAFRDQSPLAWQNRSPRVQKDGHLEIDHGTAVEHLTNSGEGLEQSFRFASRPEGHGELALRIAVGGATYAGKTANGLHFIDPKTGLGLRYGKATWIDAKGLRRDVPMHWQDNAIVLSVDEDTLDASAYPALLDPLINTEFGIDAPVSGIASGYQFDPAIAFDGENYLLVWTDSRSAEDEADIYGARISREGVLLDPYGFVISQVAGLQTMPAVVFGGGNYLVAWSDGRRDTELGTATTDIYATRVTKAGKVLEPTGTLLSSTATVASSPSLAFDGTQFFVAWSATKTVIDSASKKTVSHDVYGTRLSQSGLVLDPGGRIYPTEVVEESDMVSLNLMRVGVRQTADGFLLAAVQHLGIYCDILSRCTAVQLNIIRIRSDGTLISSNKVNETFFHSPCGGVLSNPSIAFDGTNYLVGWMGGTVERDTDEAALLARVDASGALLSTTVLQTNTDSGSCVSTPRLSFDGSNYLAVWLHTPTSNFKVKAIRVKPSGEMLDEAAVVIASGSDLRSPAIAFDGSNHLVAWADYQNKAVVGADVYAKRIDTSLQSLDTTPIKVNNGNRRAQNPLLAFDGTNYLAVWEDNRNGASSQWDLLAKRVTPSGGMLDSNPLVISNAGGSQNHSSLVFTGSQYLISWQDGRASSTNPSIYAARLGTDGTLLDPSGILMASGGYFPVSFSDGNICWWGTVIIANSLTAYIYCSQLSTSGVAGAVQTQDSTTNINSSYIVATSGNYKLYAWNYGDTIYAKVLKGASVMVSALGISSVGAEDQTVVSAPIAASIKSLSAGGDFLVSWAGTSNSISGIFGAHIHMSDGNSQPSVQPFQVLSSGTHDNPALTYDGTRYLVAWAKRTGVRGIYGSYITTDGQTLNPFGIPLATENGDEIDPAMASDGAGNILLSYISQETVKGRFVKWTPVGTTCTQNSDCAGGHCVDGYCCDSACEGSCIACSQAKTGASNGVCAPLTAGTDPDHECDANAACAVVNTTPTCRCKDRYIGDGRSCSACDAGHISMGNNRNCQICKAGSYQSENSCLACTSGSSLDGATNCTTGCPAGYYKNSTYCSGFRCIACVPCNAGTYSSQSDASSCLSCSEHYTSEAGATSCHPKCGDGYVIGNEACDDGNTQSGDGCDATCSQVEVGYDCPASGGLCQKKCLIAEAYYLKDALNPANSCESCQPSVTVGAFTPLANGTSCLSDGLGCTKDVCDGKAHCLHHVTTGCVANGACVADGTTNPQNECQACLPAISDVAYSDYPANSPCQGDAFGCTSDICDGAGRCTHPITQGCLIAGICYEAGAGNPALGQDCQGCYPELSLSGWSPRIPGYPCTDDGYLSTRDTCDSKEVCHHDKVDRCQVDGADYWDGEFDPGNDCRACTVAQSTTSFTPRPYGSPCAKDNDPATEDICDGRGTCLHTLHSTCTIGNITYAGGASPSDTLCFVCTPSSSITSWNTRAPGYPCEDDGNICTLDTCDGYGLCQHSRIASAECAAIDGDAEPDREAEADFEGEVEALLDGDGQGDADIAESGEPAVDSDPETADSEADAEPDDMKENEVDSPAEKEDTGDVEHEPESGGEGDLDGDTSDSIDLDTNIPIQAKSGGGCQTTAHSADGLLLLLGICLALRRFGRSKKHTSR